MNEYKWYDDDSNNACDREKKYSGFDNTTLLKEEKSKNKTLLTVILSSVITAVICITVFLILFYHESDKKEFLYTDNDMNSISDMEIELPEEVDTAFDLSGITDSIVNVSIKAKGDFLSQTAVVSSGNGVFLTNDGYILTSAYILESVGDIIVTLKDGSEFPASLVQTDDESYISVIKIEKNDCKNVFLGDSSSVKIGENIIGIGNKLSSGFTNPVTFGTICGYDSDILLKDGAMVNVFQTDATSIASSIGGLIFDTKGKLIGMTTAKYTISSSQIGLVTPINDLKPVIESILNNKKIVTKPNLGIIATDEEYGVVVENVAKESLAEKAGIKKGDLIIKINNSSVKSFSEIVKIKNKMKIGDKIKITIYRDGEVLDFDIIL